jgi:hypothetical protein
MFMPLGRTSWENAFNLSEPIISAFYAINYSYLPFVTPLKIRCTLLTEQIKVCIAVCVYVGPEFISLSLKGHLYCILTEFCVL